MTSPQDFLRNIGKGDVANQAPAFPPATTVHHANTPRASHARRAPSRSTPKSNALGPIGGVVFVLFVLFAGMKGCEAMNRNSACHERYMHDYLLRGTINDIGEKAYCNE